MVTRTAKPDTRRRRRSRRRRRRRGRSRGEKEEEEEIKGAAQRGQTALANARAGSPGGERR
jgi:hypothetical protein